MNIQLDVANGSWVATFRGPGANRIVGLFGTNTIPTPYTAATLPEVVLSEIRKLNADSTVTLAPTATLARRIALQAGCAVSAACIFTAPHTHAN